MSEIKLPVKYDKDGQYIWSADKKMVCDVRGWGGLASRFGEDTAVKKQDAIGEFVAKAINNHDRLETENAEMRQQLATIKKQLNVAQTIIRSASNLSVSTSAYKTAMPKIVEALEIIKEQTSIPIKATTEQK